MIQNQTFNELNNKLLRGLRQGSLLPRQIGSNRTAGVESGGVIGLEILVHSHGRGVEYDVGIRGIEVLVVETILVGVERAGHGLRLGLLHERAGEGGGRGGGGGGRAGGCSGGGVGDVAG